MKNEIEDSLSLTAPARRKLQKDLRTAITSLSEYLGKVDPIRPPASVFDPSDPKVISRFVALALVAQPRISILNLDRTYGSGIYAIYYNGPFPLYQVISKSETPIYVGSAAPELANARSALEQGDKLFARLTEHKRNIVAAKDTISAEDFEVRSLVVQSGWESSAENYLIRLFRPLWNKEVKILYGIGKHGDSAETRGNKRSPWDTVHGSRKWAMNSAEEQKSLTEIELLISEHFRDNPPYSDIDSLLEGFLTELRQFNTGT